MVTTTSTISFRRHDLDNLRTSLTGLVILHHTSISFGGLGSWPFQSVSVPGVVPTVAAFNAFNQSFFMGLFFWISGRVSAQSLSRSSSRGAFIRSKIRRLVLPAAVYTVLVNPVVAVLGLPSWDRRIVQKTLWASVSGIRGARGPVWYLATLAMFDIITAVLYKIPAAASPTTVSKSEKQTVSTAPSWLNYKSVSTWGWIPVGLACFVIRLWEPLGERTPVISVQLGYTSQFVYAYVLGHMSHWSNEERMISPLEQKKKNKKKQTSTSNKDNRDINPSLALASAISLSALALMPVPALIATDTFDANEITSQMRGGWNSFAFGYAMWNEFSFALMGPALMAYFRRWHSSGPKNRDGGGKQGVVSARNAYAAFLVHAPVGIAISRVLDTCLCWGGARPAWMDTAVWTVLGPLVMTGSAGLMSVYGSFLVGSKLLEWVPGMTAIL
ncbi:acyltransferase 3 [Microdochium trichocladiopsis]|uniref:Acyltransferase 3 n=1 Tax=Microdochium trichocladiopsis TaxID=1682393 RepID=A0A9P8YI48_9PEZI|nr:acyltransferase 3 [Microdochium trichocladiopsis]KAH7039676.1 acyltransferase 3 [Microdochium trichocladiopsis]